MRFGALGSRRRQVDISLKRESEFPFQAPAEKSESWEDAIHERQRDRGAFAKKLINLSDIEAVAADYVIAGGNFLARIFQNDIRVSPVKRCESPVYFIQRQKRVEVIPLVALDNQRLLFPVAFKKNFLVDRVDQPFKRG